MERTSYLEVFDIETNERRVLHAFEGIIEAPNWTKDGKALIFNRQGRLYRYDIVADSAEMLDSGDCGRCNNDHVLSPDGTQIGISHALDTGWQSCVYIMPAAGGTPRAVTSLTPSFLHGWSPDGKHLAYCAFRKEAPDGDIYCISVDGGEETRLTDAPGLNDGPEYAPDGRIWFNSVRTGRMQAWRMNADGSDQTQMTFDEDFNTWFPHVSPDGKQAVMIAYRKEELKPSEHLPDKHVQLRLMSAEGGSVRVLCEVFGGQGTINVNSWAPDSKRFAFVSYNEP